MGEKAVWRLSRLAGAVGAEACCNVGAPQGFEPRHFRFRNSAWRVPTRLELRLLDSLLLATSCSPDSGTPWEGRCGQINGLRFVGADGHTVSLSLSQLLVRLFPTQPLAPLITALDPWHYARVRGHPVLALFRVPNDEEEPTAAAAFRRLAQPPATPCTLYEGRCSSHGLGSAAAAPSSHVPPAAGCEETAVAAATSHACRSPLQQQPPSAHPQPPQPPPSSPPSFPTDGPPVPSSLFRVAFEFSTGLCVTRERFITADNGRSGNSAGAQQHQRRRTPVMEALVIRRLNDDFFELPKGHLEHAEALATASLREVREETGILNCLQLGQPLLSEIYSVKSADDRRIEKTVHYFQAHLQRNLCPQDFRVEGAATTPPQPWSTDLCDACCALELDLLRTPHLPAPRRGGPHMRLVQDAAAESSASRADERERPLPCTAKATDAFAPEPPTSPAAAAVLGERPSSCNRCDCQGFDQREEKQVFQLDDGACGSDGTDSPTSRVDDGRPLQQRPPPETGVEGHHPSEAAWPLEELLAGDEPGIEVAGIATANGKDKKYCCKCQQENKSINGDDDADGAATVFAFFGQREAATVELRWLSLAELRSVRWKSDTTLRAAVRALTATAITAPAQTSSATTAQST